MDYGLILTTILGIITNIATGYTSWFLTKKKYYTEVDNNLIINMQQSLEFYKKISDDNRERLDEILLRNEELEKKNDELDREVKDLKNQMINMMSSICTDLTCQIRKNDRLKK